MSSENGKWETISSELALEHPYLRVTMETVKLPNGQIIDEYPIVQARDYVNAVIVNGQGEALVMSGYRHGAGRDTWQLIGGMLDDNEDDTLDAIKRKLMEVSGMKCRYWRHLSSFVVDPNRKVGTGHFFLGYGAEKISEPTGSDLESIHLEWISLADIKRAVWDGRINVMSYAVNVSMALLALEIH